PWTSTQLMMKLKIYQQRLPAELLTLINTFTVSSFIQTSCESSVDAWSKEARWNSLLPSNSLLQTTQRCSLSNSTICFLFFSYQNKQPKETTETSKSSPAEQQRVFTDYRKRR